MAKITVSGKEIEIPKGLRVHGGDGNFTIMATVGKARVGIYVDEGIDPEIAEEGIQWLDSFTGKSAPKVESGEASK